MRHEEQGERLGQVAGDRVCISCGFNLVGQTTWREPEYGMVIVRCPECGTCASLQEYPHLGRWANRWAFALGAAWIAAFLLVCFAAAGCMYWLATRANDQAAWLYSSILSEECNEWALANYPEVMSNTGSATYWNEVTRVQQEWEKRADFDAILEEHGGLLGAIHRSVIPFCMSACLSGFLFGLMLCVMMLGYRKRRLWIVGAICCAGSILYLLVHFIGLSARARFSHVGPVDFHALARDQMMWMAAWVTIGVGTLGLLAGLYTGRSAARWLVSLLLPPRYCSALAELWLCDGKEPPRPTGRG